MTNTELSNKIIGDWEETIRVKISKCNLDLLNDFIIEGIHKARELQHEATKTYVFEAHEEFNGLDFELLETIEMPELD